MSPVFMRSLWRFAVARIRQHDRRVALARGDVPVCLQQTIFLLLRHQLEPVALVEPDRPACVGPGADQETARALRAQRLEQGAANALALVGAADIGMSD